MGGFNFIKKGPAILTIIVHKEITMFAKWITISAIESLVGTLLNFLKQCNLESTLNCF